MHRIILTILSALLILLAIIACQSKESIDSINNIQRVFGREGSDCAYAIINHYSGNNIIAGETVSMRGKDKDVYLVMTDSKGQVISESVFGGEDNDYARDMALTHDNGFIVVGTTHSFGKGMGDIYVIRFNSRGDSLWAMTYGSQKSDQGNSIVETNDGGFCLTGSTLKSADNYDVIMIKIDSTGAREWSKTFGGIKNDFGRDIKQIKDGGFIVVGATESFGHGGMDAYLIRTNSEGDSILASAYGSIEFDEGNSVAQTQDNGFIITGTTHLDAPAGDVLLIKTDIDGNEKWRQTFGSYQGDGGNDLILAPDGGYLIAGYYTTPYNPDIPISPNVYIIKTNALGDPEWEYDIGDIHADYGYSAILNDKNECIIVGQSSTAQHTAPDIFWIKLFDIGK